MAWRMVCDMVIPGEAVPQGRPRWGNGHAYDPEKSRRYKAYVREVARENVPPDEREWPVTGSVKLTCIIYRGVPKSWSRCKRELALAEEIDPITKPDLSNYIKGIEDALKGVWYVDDSQVIDCPATKVYAEEPRVYVRMEVKARYGEE